VATGWSQACALLVMILLTAGFGWRIWSMFVAAPSDQPRIRRNLDGPYQKVVSISRNGFWPGGRWGPDYRLYQVVTEDVEGRRIERTVGVAARLFSDPELKVARPGQSFGLLRSQSRL
jgi:hypothetical protein